ncbi:MULTISPECIES: EAL domain-containing protein [Achromobacter]|uniref:EAL domain-containing protein n=1 Tax=Achromobacter spanius TaxID=217203 RepID=A0ABY8GXU7_9BURK|nr:MULTISPECIES: EAL domain-containing protein [Achromobacter]WAI81326.1 EAL domain-containing protein [Achromobacter spanius]WEX96844.1 EAL domain-containing protein [Achromobacter sp. SS2-2022]WFP09440.1 EAL domain-containing protein [Achromobacter spanius]
MTSLHALPRPIAARTPLTLSGDAPATVGLAGILQDRLLRPRFQPVVDLSHTRIYGHESLIRGPADTALHFPDALFAEARRRGLHPQLELASFRAGAQGFHDNEASGKLFLNLSGSALIHFWTLWGGDMPGHLLEGCALPASSIIVELTEQDPLSDHIGELTNAFACLREHGMRIALDDYGVGNSNLQLWAEMQPDLVKIDRYFFDGIGHDDRKQSMVRAILKVAQHLGTSIVAEGIETAEDLAVVRELDIRYAQGWFLGRPEETLLTELTAPVRDSLRVRSTGPLSQRAAGGTAASLRVEAPAALLDKHTNDDVHRLFIEHKAMHAVAVVDADNRPVGIINRRDFSEHYAQRYTRELFGRDRCSTFMNAEPVLVDLNVSIDQLSHVLISEDQRYLMDGLIITRDGRYDGLATGETLVRSVTEMRIEAARYANPLTSLPGNIPISRHIATLLEDAADFTVCYGDLNNFKPFNDVYGYWRGDDMIMLTAEVIKHHCDPLRDFVGHVGGDDFVVLFRSPDWTERVQRIIVEFNEQATALYDDLGRKNGGIEAEDRYGVPRFFPFVTLGVGALTVTPSLCERIRPEDIASAAANVKHKVKHGNLSLVIERYTGGVLPDLAA